MPDTTGDVVAELVRLRRGWGLDTVDLRDRVGSHIRSVCDVGADDTTRVIRQKVLTRFQALAAGLPQEERLAISLALGGEPGRQMAQLTQREEILAEHLHCSMRTARRRIDHALRRLAEEIAAAYDRPNEDLDNPDKGWYVRRLEALVRLDTPTPEMIEKRTVVATRDGLTRISLRISLPQAEGASTPPNIFADTQQGARIESTTRVGNHFHFVLDLPRVLGSGEEHAYTMTFKIPEGQPIRSHYAFVPLVLADAFDLRIRFSPQRPPRLVWRVDHLAPRGLDERIPGEPLVLDGAGEIHLAFAKLENGFGYGVCWQPDDRPAGLPGQRRPLTDQATGTDRVNGTE